MFKKDVIVFYMFRNIVAVLVVTVISFVIALMGFYQCSLTEALLRLLIYDLYTTLYFILMCVFNYIVFEISKILYDTYRDKVKLYPCILTIGLAIAVFFVPMLNVFQYNFCLLSLLISFRMIKEVLVKKTKTPKKKKRPKMV